MLDDQHTHFLKITPQQIINKSTVPEKTPGTRSSSPPTANENGLVPGRLIKALIIGVGEGGKVTVETAAGSIEAKSLAPLEVGKEIWFEVVKGGQMPLLSPSTKLNSVDELLRMLLPGMRAFTEQQGQLGVQTQDSLTGGKPAAADLFLNILNGSAVGESAEPEKIIKFISWLNSRDAQPPQSKSGVEIASLNSSELVGLLEKLDKPGLQKLVRLLDAHSQLTSSQPQEGAAKTEQYLLFPSFFAGESGWGEWLFSFDSDQRGSEQESQINYNISFYLSMSQLGDVHLKLHQKEGALSGVFSFETKEAADHVRKNLPELVGHLEELFAPVNLNCVCSEKLILQQLKEDLSAKSGVNNFALLDVTA